MSFIVLSGAVRSGKSSAAERLALRRRRRVIVAVASREDDEEMERRIAEHRATRPPTFEVVEVGTDPSWIADVPLEAVLVVECLGTIVGSMVGEKTGGDGDILDAFRERRLQKQVNGLMNALCTRGGDTIVVTNETGWGVVPVYASGRVFRDLMGRANRALVERADAAYLVVDGRFLDLKALGTDADWPHDAEDSE